MRITSKAIMPVQTKDIKKILSDERRRESYHETDN